MVSCHRWRHIFRPIHSSRRQRRGIQIYLRLRGPLKDGVLAECLYFLSGHGPRNERSPHWTRRHGINTNSLLARRLCETFRHIRNRRFRGGIGDQLLSRLECLNGGRIDNGAAPSIFSSAAWVRKNVPETLVRNGCSNSSAGISSILSCVI